MTVYVLSMVLFVAITYFCRKRVSKVDLYATALFVIVIGYKIDMIFGFKHDLYGYFQSDVSYRGILVMLIIYPAVSIIFTNFFPYDKSTWRKACYIGGWSLFSLVYEWIAVLDGMFVYTGWKLWYSIPIYPVLYLMMVLHIGFMRKFREKHS